jgi:hypothetical protein
MQSKPQIEKIKRPMINRRNNEMSDEDKPWLSRKIRYKRKHKWVRE